MKNETRYLGFFSHLLHEKLKVWWNCFPKKLSEHIRLLGSSEYALSVLA
jgi:hypothetical protein